MPTDTTIIDRLREDAGILEQHGGFPTIAVELREAADALTTAHAARDAAEERANLNERMALYATLETRKAGERLTTALRERDEARAALEAARDECDRVGKCPFVEGA